LQLLDNLGEAAWAQVLLPKLYQNGSARRLALVCSQLRALVHGSTRQLDFSRLSHGHSAAEVEAWTTSLQDRFPRCRSAALHITCEDSYLLAQTLVASLARYGSHLARSTLTRCTTVRCVASLASDAFNDFQGNG